MVNHMDLTPCLCECGDFNQTGGGSAETCIYYILLYLSTIKLLHILECHLIQSYSECEIEPFALNSFISCKTMYTSSKQSFKGAWDDCLLPFL